MTRHIVPVLVVSLLAAWPSIACGQDTSAPAATQPFKYPELLKALEGAVNLTIDPVTDFAPPMPEDSRDDANSAAAYNMALQRYYQYRVDSYQHRSSVFSWQLFSSRIIFVVVILIVLVGLLFSWLQFRAAIVARPQTPVPDPDDPDAMRSELSFSKEGLRISSPVLGLMILVVSLAFFYLYLVYVYPVEDTF